MAKKMATAAPIRDRPIYLWLQTNVDSHHVYNAAELIALYEKETGKIAARWPISIDENSARVVSGYLLAIRLAEQYCTNYRCTKSGRGFAFDEAVAALRKEGI